MEREENIGFVKSLRNFFSKFSARPTVQGGDEERQSTEYMPKGSGHTGWYKIMKEWYSDAMARSGSRFGKYDTYDFLDMNLAEASASLNIYADNTVSGAPSGRENYKVLIDEGTPGAELIEDVVEKTDRN